METVATIMILAGEVSFIGVSLYYLWEDMEIDRKMDRLMAEIGAK